MLGDITNSNEPRVNRGLKLVVAFRRCAKKFVGANHPAPGVAGEHGPDLLGGNPPPSGMPEPLKPDPAQSPPAAKAPPPPMEKTIAPIQVSALERVETATRKLAKEPHVVALYARLKQAGVGDELLKLCWQHVATKGVTGIMELIAVIHLGKSEGKKMKADAQQHERNMSPLEARAEEAKARGDTHEEIRLAHEQGGLQDLPRQARRLPQARHAPRRGKVGHPGREQGCRDSQRAQGGRPRGREAPPREGGRRQGAALPAQGRQGGG